MFQLCCPKVGRRVAHPAHDVSSTGRSAGLLLLGLVAFTFAGCPGSSQYVIVNVIAGVDLDPGTTFTALGVTLEHELETSSNEVFDSFGARITLPTTFSAGVPLRFTGSLLVTVDGLDGLARIATGSSTVVLTGESVEVTVTLRAVVGGTDAGTDAGTDGGGDDAGTDAGADSGPPGVCAPNQPYCDADGRTLHVCNGAGTGPEPGLDVTCSWVCDTDTCRYPSNLDEATVAACDATAPPLAPPAGDSVLYADDAITCSTNCGTGLSIPVVPGPRGMNVACVSQLDIQSGTILQPAGATRGLILIVAGSADVAGEILFDGDAGGISVAGAGAPGGDAGGEPGPCFFCMGSSGNGDGGGVGGEGGEVGAGGGGAGHGGLGGGGGDAPGFGIPAFGGPGGGTHGDPELIPLLGGSGGGGGGSADFGCLTAGGGGGGGGAIQITARDGIAVSGLIASRGALGGSIGCLEDGAGGGGSGGGILLEALDVDIIGLLNVNGGDGGTADGAGGLGASGAMVDGAPGGTASLGGGGGGGACGRIRINSATGSGCVPAISPTLSCAMGPLRSVPSPICFAGVSDCAADGRTLRTCDAAGLGYDPTLDVVCGFVCNAGACSYASNVLDSDFAGCDASAAPLTPSPGQSVQWTGADITCDVDCGGGSVSIPLFASTGGADVVCVSALNLPSGVTMTGASGGNALILLVAGDATVDGSIDFDGQDGPSFGGGPPGLGGPGGSAGGLPNPCFFCAGSAGAGMGGGQGGSAQEFAGGGGGGGYAGPGGSGGDSFAFAPVPGGPGGGTYGLPDIRPLLGGSGGGAGGSADFGCFTAGGAGGGGGVLQISVRGSLSIGGTITAGGGLGGDAGCFEDGGGGGGSGGAILLEATSYLAAAGLVLRVDGGNGGNAGGPGGPGAIGATLAGTTAPPVPDGGGGGGGGGGWIRINAVSGASCSGTSPTPACSTGALLITPGP